MVENKIQLNSNGDSINHYIRVYDKAFHPSILNKLHMYAKKPPINNSYKSSLNKPSLGTFKDNKIRSSTSEPFVAYGNESMTSVVLCNYIMSYLMHYAKDYLKNIQKATSAPILINQIELLRYSKQDHFKLHIDSGTNVLRTLSFIFMINDDYQGGDLKFILQTDEKKQAVIESKSNRLIIFPSNFMYPHVVEPVQKGERYTVVAWAI